MQFNEIFSKIQVLFHTLTLGGAPLFMLLFVSWNECKKHYAAKPTIERTIEQNSYAKLLLWISGESS